MKILFQGGWKEGRNPPDSKELIQAYCTALAEDVVRRNHTLVLGSNRDFDKFMAQKMSAVAQNQGKNLKDHLMFLLPQRENVIPKEGRVVRIPQKSWWIEERTYCIQNTDVLIAVGGGRGTFDCVEKAFLSRKPVFVASAVPCSASLAWKNRDAGYKYLAEGDADVLDDLNITAEEFFSHVFRIIDSLSAVAYPRRIFIVHGHDHHLRDTLAEILRKLGFEPIVLQDEASRSLTIIEKLERDTGNVGFAVVLYTPDDFCRQAGTVENARCRQNVVFEHGLLIGLLGRDRTCAIVHGDVEVPSDIHGMIYEQVRDLKGEAIKIARVLKNAGYSIDATKLL